MLLFVAIVCVLIFLVLYADVKKPRNYPKGPPWIPIVGNFAHFKKRIDELKYHHLAWEELRSLYGNVVGLKLGRNLVVTAFGPDAVMEVLTREEFDGRPDGFFFRFRTFGKRLGVVFSDGSLWQTQRKFSVQNLRHFGLGKKDMQLKIEEEALELVESLKEKCGSPVSFQNLFDISVLNVLWSMLAGRRFSLGDPKLQELFGLVNDAFKMIDMSGGVLNQLPFLRFVAPDASGYTRITNIINRLLDFFRETIEEHKRTLCDSHSRDFVDSFLHKMASQDGDSTFTDEQLLSMCLDLFMAGSETTSNTLSFAILYMLEYPEVLSKVQMEMDSVTGGNRCPTLQDRTSLPYTEATLMEVQRIANIPPMGIPHRAVKDADILGRSVPKGTIVLASLYSVHMDEEFWKDPQVFRPERFLNDDGKIFVPEKYFMPFGFGKRRCLGESLAKASYFTFFTALAHNFTLHRNPRDPTLDLKGNDGFTLSPKPFSACLQLRSI